MKLVNEGIEFLEESNISDIDYLEQVLSDADRLTISVCWGFDEQQADPFHHKFNSHEFFRRLRRMIKQLEVDRHAKVA